MGINVLQSQEAIMYYMWRWNLIKMEFKLSITGLRSTRLQKILIRMLYKQEQVSEISLKTKLYTCLEFS